MGMLVRDAIFFATPALWTTYVLCSAICACLLQVVCTVGLLCFLASIYSSCHSRRKAKQTVLTLAHEFAGRVEHDQRADYELFLHVIHGASVGVDIFPIGIVTMKKVFYCCR